MKLIIVRHTLTWSNDIGGHFRAHEETMHNDNYWESSIFDDRYVQCVKGLNELRIVLCLGRCDLWALIAEDDSTFA